MKLERKAFPLEVKETGTAGEFSGYLSVFGNIDSYREVVEPGAFSKSLEEWSGKGRLPPVLWQHDSSQPIGFFTSMEEDEVGLKVAGQLLIDDIPRAKEANALVRAGVIGGMSIGFQTIAEKADSTNKVRRLTELKLWEGSIVTFPANEAAQISAVKMALSHGDLPSMKDFEKFLRESGFSKTQAVAVANGGLSKLLRSESESDLRDTSFESLITAIKNTKPTL